MPYCLAFLLLIALATAPHANGQVHFDEVRPPAAENISKLEATITMDRAVYVPGEVAQITLSFRNPTNQVLEVPQPFWAKRAGFDLWVKGGPMALRYLQEYGPVAQHTYSEFPPSPDTPAVHLLPGEVLTRTIRSNDPILHGRSYLSGGTVPGHPGLYRLSYSYAPLAEVGFEVKAATLEHFAKLDLHQESVVDPDGTTRLITPSVCGLVVVLDGKRMIMRTTGAGHLVETPTTPSVLGVTTSPLEFPNLQRIAEVTGPVTALRLEKQTGGLIKFLWANEAGTWSELLVPGEEPRGTFVPFSIAVSPATASLHAGERQRFRPTVTGVADIFVTWTVALGPGAPAGAQPGSVSWDGYYEAPALVSSNYPVIVIARSRADLTKTATAVVSLLATKAISTPVAPGGPQQGQSGVLQQYAVSGAASNSGHPVQCSFN